MTERKLLVDILVRMVGRELFIYLLVWIPGRGSLIKKSHEIPRGKFLREHYMTHEDDCSGWGRRFVFEGRSPDSGRRIVYGKRSPDGRRRIADRKRSPDSGRRIVNRKGKSGWRVEGC
jgi:hypothetical protein